MEKIPLLFKIIGVFFTSVNKISVIYRGSPFDWMEATKGSRENHQTIMEVDYGI